jgi:hypothetical protein
MGIVMGLDESVQLFHRVCQVLEPVDRHVADTKEINVRLHDLGAKPFARPDHRGDLSLGLVPFLDELFQGLEGG